MAQTPRGASEGVDIAEAMARVRTKRELAALFRYLGIRCQKRLGQHFLVDHNLLAFMVRAGEVGPGDLVLDIGSGTGLLTGYLVDAAAGVVAIEKDRRLVAICSRYLEGRPNLRLLCGDVLASKHKLAPLLLDAVEREWASGRYTALRVVSNLPYSIASLVVPNLLESQLAVTSFVVTVQKEVADRMCAEPRRKHYGALSVVVQAHARAEVLRRVPPSVFWPRPQVDSAIVRLVPEACRRAAVADYERFVEIVRGAFGHRRKSVANALATSHAVPRKAALDSTLAACGIEPTQRAEQLSVEQYIALANTLPTTES